MKLSMLALSLVVAVAARAEEPPVGSPAVAVSPAGYDYGEVAIGGRRYAEFTVKNSSELPVFLSNEISGNGESFHVVQNLCPAHHALPPAHECAVTVVFTPHDGAQATTNFTMNYGVTNEDRTQYSTSFTVTGRGPVPVGQNALVATPAYIDFGTTSPYMTEYRSVTLSNVSDHSMYIYSIQSPSNAFKLSISDCPRTPAALAPNGTCTVNISFKPNQRAEETARIPVLYGVTAEEALYETAITVKGAGQ